MVTAKEVAFPIPALKGAFVLLDGRSWPMFDHHHHCCCEDCEDVVAYYSMMQCSTSPPFGCTA